MKKEPRATVRDIAKVVGVAPSTVSRALSQPHLVAPDRRKEIRRVAEEMGYQANSAARGLSTGRTENIAVIVPDLENPLFAAVIKGMQSRARTRGYATVVADSEEDARLEDEPVKTLGHTVDGVVVFSPRTAPDVLRRHSSQFPMVLVNRPTDGVHNIVVDNHGGMVHAVTHLRALGHRVIAHVSGPADSWPDKSRAEGISDAADGLEIIEIGHVAPSTFTGGVAVADQVLASGATAVICYNDLIALGVLNRVTARGVRVPDELSIVGFDDIPAVRLVAPALTTLSAPLDQIGKEAVDLLLAEIRERSPARSIVFSPSLVVRDSTGVPPVPAH